MTVDLKLDMGAARRQREQEQAEANITKLAVEQPPLELFDPTELDGVVVPARRWVVRDWIPWGYVTALYGDGGTGKTLLAQMLTTASAVGYRWLGLDTAGPLKVLALLCEDDRDELHRRQASINALYGCSFADLGNIRWGERLGKDNLMMTFDHAGNGCLVSLDLFGWRG